MSLLGCVVTMDAFLSARAAELRDTAEMRDTDEMRDTADIIGARGSAPVRRPAYFYRDISDGDSDAASSDSDGALAADARADGDAGVGASKGMAAADSPAGSTSVAAPSAVPKPASPPAGAASSAAVGGGGASAGAEPQATASNDNASSGAPSDSLAAALPSALPATDASAPTARHNITLRRPRLIADLLTRTARLRRMETEAAAEAASAEGGDKPLFHWP